MPIIEVKHLKKYFGQTKAVSGVSFVVEQREVFGFLGPNGAGKTTTIRCMMDFVRPTAGEIKIFGLDSIKDSVAIKKEIGFLPGGVRLYENWNGWDHIEFLEKARGRQSIARQLIKQLDFNPEAKFKTLSLGNRQKLGLVLALMFQPKLLILDEPTLGLDPLLQNMVYQILLDFHQKGTTIFMSSHNLAEVEKICSRVAIVKEGKLITTEEIANLKKMRIHQVIVHFRSRFRKADFECEGAKVVEEFPDGLYLQFKGEMNLLLDRLRRYPIKDLEISQPSLEEIFLQFYGKE